MRIKVTKEQSDFIKQNGSRVEANDKKYYYIPFWFMETEIEGVFEELSFDKLPEALKKEIKSNRDSQSH